jgi:hypothetical protein
VLNANANMALTVTGCSMRSVQLAVKSPALPIARPGSVPAMSDTPDPVEPEEPEPETPDE